MNEKLYWKVKYKTDFAKEYDFLETILTTNGIKQEDIPTFMHPTKKCIHDPFLMKNMDKAVEMIHDNIGKGKRIYIKVDVDVDGYTSSSALIQFIQSVAPDTEINWETDYNKAHGLTFKNLSVFKKNDLDLVIVPDASLTCKDGVNIKRNFPDLKIVVLDHHIIEPEYYSKSTGNWFSKIEAEKLMAKREKLEEHYYTEFCDVVVNCHDGQYPNPDLCGAGVIQKFIEAYCKTYDVDEEETEKYLDLVSLGLIADVISAKSFEARYYMLEGLKERNHRNEFLNELAERFKDEIKFNTRTITNVGWVLAPKINGCIRFGKPEEQENLCRAIIGEHEDIEYQPRRKSKNDLKPPIEIHSLQWNMARICDNVKSRQDTEVRKYMQKIDDKIQAEKLYKNSILFVDGTEILEKGTVSGLVANKLTSKYFRPVVLLREKNSTEYGGSARGYDKGNIDNLNEFLTKVGITALGHSNAMGIIVKKKDLPSIIKKCNELMPLSSLQTIHQVDWEIPASQLKKEYVTEVAENYTVFGNGIPEPLFAITDLRINASQIHGYGEHNGFIRFVYNGIVFVKKYCPIGDYENMIMKDRKTFGTSKKNLKLNLICQFVLNVWEDKVNPEVKILFYDVEEDKGGTDSISKDIGLNDIKTDIDKKVESKTKPKKTTAIDLDDDFESMWEDGPKKKVKEKEIDDSDFWF